MGDLSDKLDEFQELSKEAYSQIINILENSYCWKCPMRSTSSKARCREVHAGRVLQEVVEGGMLNHLLNKDIPPVEAEAIITRMLKKKIKKQGGDLREQIILMKPDVHQTSETYSDKVLVVKINPKRALPGELVLIPDGDVEHPLLGAYALLSGFPFQIKEVEKTHHEGTFWYVLVDDAYVLPLESIFGVLLKCLRDGELVEFD